MIKNQIHFYFTTILYKRKLIFTNFVKFTQKRFEVQTFYLVFSSSSFQEFPNDLSIHIHSDKRIFVNDMSQEMSGNVRLVKHRTIKPKISEPSLFDEFDH